MLDADLLQIDAPKGQRWAGNGCHTIVCQFRNYSQSWLPEARADVAETMSYGLEACADVDCDVCQD